MKKKKNETEHEKTAGKQDERIVFLFGGDVIPTSSIAK